MFEESGKTRTSGREAVTKSARASSSSKRLLEVQFLRARRTRFLFPRYMCERSKIRLLEDNSLEIGTGN